MIGFLKAPPALKRNIGLLSLAWSCSSLVALMLVSVSILAGHLLAEDKSLAALPITLQWVGTAATTVPASLLMQRIGRRYGFMVAASIIIAGGLIGAFAIDIANFWLFCAATTLVGAGMSFNWYYRFAAAEVASEEYRSRAISLVLAGGIAAAILGPTLAIWSRDLFAPVIFSGTFLVIAGLATITLVLLQFVEIPRPPAVDLHGGRPLSVIAAQPAFRVAVIGGVVSYSVMVLMMAVTPLAMEMCGHGFADAAFVIQWHVLGMYVPSFFTGHLIRRFGVIRIMLAGAALLMATVAVGASGISLVHFWLALALLGGGWNFLFIGATTLLTETYRPAERAKAQGLNEMLVFGTSGVGVFLSGHMLTDLGWTAVTLAALPAIAAAAGAVLWLGQRRQKVPA